LPKLLGINVAYENNPDDPRLLAIMNSEERALLTRDRRLLMHSIVAQGYYLRSQDAEEQTLEVIRRFDLRDAIEPYTRCLMCNATLAHVSKMDIDHALEPLTRIYYQDFRQCTGCARVYWSGSHSAKLTARIERIRSACGRDKLRE
jgi:uncharacterized protein with PIN domain